MYSENEDFDGFKRKVLNSVKEYYGEQYEVSVKEVIKLNGVILHGLNIMERATTICPTIYLEDYFNRYNDGDNFSKLFEEIIGVYESCKSPRFLGLEFFSDYEKIKNSLSVKLINANLNKSLLEDVPHKLIEDLALVCMVDMKSESGNFGTVLIHNNHICMWGIRRDQLIDDAISNSQTKSGVFVKKLNDLVLEICGKCEDGEEFLPDKEEFETLGKDPDTMYVLSNERQTNGASVIAYPGVLESIFNELKDDFYIIPSSIHEVIILPYNISKTVPNINSMVQSVNAEMLEREEILSDHVYFYSGKTNQLSSVYDTPQE